MRLTWDWPDIDIISTSSIHQGTPHVDFSLKIDQDQIKQAAS